MLTRVGGLSLAELWPSLEHWPTFETWFIRLKGALETALWLQVCLMGRYPRLPQTKRLVLEVHLSYSHSNMFFQSRSTISFAAWL